MGAAKTSSKTALKPSQAGLFTYAAPQLTGTLESAVIAALKAAAGSMARPSSKKAGRTVRPGNRPVGKKAAASGATRFGTLDSKAMASLGEQSRKLRAALLEQGLLEVRTVRVRHKGDVDRRLYVEFAVDPADQNVVILRVRTASAAELPDEKPAMLTSQQAADALNVSRPYLTHLADTGVLRGVETRPSGHRRIPTAEVERMRAEMQAAQRAAISRMDDITESLREKELDAARKKAKRRWVQKAA